MVSLFVGITLGLSQTTVQLSGISLKTTAFAPILQLLPTRTLPIILAPAPIYTLSPMTGAPLFDEPGKLTDPIVTC